MQLREKMRKRIKKEYTIEDLIEDIKHNEYTKALDGVLRTCEHKERIHIVSDIFINSKYKSYKVAMQKFNEAVVYFLEGNKRQLDQYMNDILEEEKKQPMSIVDSTFDVMRRYILLDMRSNSFAYSYMALLHFAEDPLLSNHPELMPIISTIAAKKWPNHSAIKILFG